MDQRIRSVVTKYILRNPFYTQIFKAKVLLPLLGLLFKQNSFIARAIIYLIELRSSISLLIWWWYHHIISISIINQFIISHSLANLLYAPFNSQLNSLIRFPKFLFVYSTNWGMSLLKFDCRTFNWLSNCPNSSPISLVSDRSINCFICRSNPCRLCSCFWASLKSKIYKSIPYRMSFFVLYRHSSRICFYRRSFSLNSAVSSFIRTCKSWICSSFKCTIPKKWV